MTHLTINNLHVQHTRTSDAHFLSEEKKDQKQHQQH